MLGNQSAQATVGSCGAITVKEATSDGKSGEIWRQQERLEKALYRVKQNVEIHRQLIAAIQSQGPTPQSGTNQAAGVPSLPPTYTELGGRIADAAKFAEDLADSAESLNNGLQI